MTWKLTVGLWVDRDPLQGRKCLGRLTAPSIWCSLFTFHIEHGGSQQELSKCLLEPSAHSLQFPTLPCKLDSIAQGESPFPPILLVPSALGSFTLSAKWRWGWFDFYKRTWPAGSSLPGGSMFINTSHQTRPLGGPETMQWLAGILFLRSQSGSISLQKERRRIWGRSTALPNKKGRQNKAVKMTHLLNLNFCLISKD